MTDFTATMDEAKGVIVLAYPTSMAPHVSRVPGRNWVANERRYEVPATACCAAWVTKVYDEHGGTVSDAVRQLGYQARARTHAIRAPSGELPRLGHYPDSKLTPRDHQRRGMAMLHAADSCYLAWDMGTGKTKIPVDHIVRCLPPGGIALIVCPLKVVANWPSEFEKHGHLEGAAPVTLVRCDHKSGRTNIKRVEAAFADRRKAEANEHVVTPRTVVLVNFESVWRTAFAALVERHMWDIIVLDEAHRAKGEKGKIGVFAREILRRRARRRLCLSGTPMPNGPLDIWNQCAFLDPGLLGSSFADFKARYTTAAKVERDRDWLIIEAGYSDVLAKALKAVPSAQFMTREGRKQWVVMDPADHEKAMQLLQQYRRTIKQHVGYQNLDQLNDLLGRIMHRITKDEALDLPDLIHTTVPVTVGIDCRRLCAEISEDLEAELESGEKVVAANAAVKLLRLLQFASGCTKDENGIDHQVDEAKGDALHGMLVDMDPTYKVVVFYNFRPNAIAIETAAGDAERECFFINGDVDEIEKWRAAEGGAVIAVQIQSGGTGINLTMSHEVFYFSTGCRLADFEQSLSRAHRDGQEHTTNVYHLYAEDTAERLVAEAFQSKREVIDHVLSNLGSPA